MPDGHDEANEPTQYDHMLAAHPMRMRWEAFKLWLDSLIWRRHPRRNRWCAKCGAFAGNSAADERKHKCEVSHA